MKIFKHITSLKPDARYDYWPTANLAFSTLLFFSLLSPTPLPFGFYSIWFVCAFGDSLAGDEAAGELISPTDALSLDELHNEKLASEGHQKEPGLCGGGQPCRAIQAFYLLKGDFVLKTFPFVCSHEKRSLLKAARIWWLCFKMNTYQFPNPAAVLESHTEPLGDGEPGRIIRLAIPWRPSVVAVDLRSSNIELDCNSDPEPLQSPCFGFGGKEKKILRLSNYFNL